MSSLIQQTVPVESLLQELRAQDIHIRLEGEDLRVSAPPGTLTPDLRETLGRHKADLLAHLQADEGKSNSGDLTPLLRVDRERVLPLSFAQERMWILQQMDHEPNPHRLQFVFLIKADVAGLQRAWNALLDRHEILRTTYRMNDEGRLVQIIHAPQRVELPVVDSSVFTEAEFMRDMRERANEYVRMPFDLAQGPVWRILVFRLRNGMLGILISIHHIASDGWSINHLIKELNELCRAYAEGRTPQLAELPVQYVDYAIWQRQWLQGERLARELDYWRERLAGMPMVLDLPLDYPRPAVQTFEGAGCALDLPEVVAAGISALGQRHRVTLFMTLLAVFKVLLFRYTGQTDIVVGAPIAGRDRPEIEHVQGLFLNTLVLRTELSGELRFSELLARVRDTTLGAYAHQDLPFEKLVDEIHPQRNLSSNPLFQCLFNKLLVPAPDREALEEETPVQLDLALNVYETAGAVTLLFKYNKALFRRETIERMAGHFLNVAEAVGRDAEQALKALPLLTNEERRQLLTEWNRTERSLPADPVSRLFEQQVSRSPHTTALVFGDEQLSYAELNARANRLARYLRSLGVGREAKVGVLLERSVQMVVGVLGVLKAGGAYVPLDPAYPEERVAFMVQDSEAGLLLSEERLLSGLPAGGARVVCVDRDAEAIAAHSGDDLESGPSPVDLAYMIYTSGSTGQPKGVQIEHRALSNFLQSMAREPGLDQHDVLLAVTTLSFDIAGLELYLPLIRGARLVLAGREVTSDGMALSELLQSSGATVMQATPATWRLLLAAGWPGGAQLKVLCGGEAMPQDLAEQLLGCCAELWNLYGPTETTIWSTVYRVQSGAEAVPIGRPIANTCVYIVDENLQPVPVGVLGEFYIGGAGVARGYWKRASLDAERFVADVFSGESGARMYRTGDRARYLPDGNIEFLGRLDNQVKLRGFRIELGEIEVALERLPQVRQAVAVIREDAPGDKRLVAYVVVQEAVADLVEQLRTQLRESLPEYMVPSAFVTLDKMPLTPNGKVDRKALPAPERESQVSAVYVAPGNELEQKLVAVWQEVLRMEKVGVDDNFFDLGGNSLLVTRVHARIKPLFERDLHVIDLFRFPTIRLLADHFGQAEVVDVSTRNDIHERAKKQQRAMRKSQDQRN